MSITPLQHDFSYLRELEFDNPPVAVKFEFFKPESIERLETTLALCEMVREAQKRDVAFYMDREVHAWQLSRNEWLEEEEGIYTQLIKDATKEDYER